MFTSRKMTIPDQKLSRNMKQEWNSTKFQSNKLEKPDENNAEEKEELEKQKDLLEEFSSWSIDDDDDEPGNSGRLSNLTSWGEDDFEKQITEHVAEMFANIDDCLYENVPLANEKLQQECQDWAQRFPHLRIIGTQISPSLLSPGQTYPRPLSVTLSQSMSKKRTRHMTSKELEDYEEIFAHHSSDSQTENKSSTSHQSLFTLPNGPVSPGSSFKEQALDAVFDILWPDLVPLLTQFVKSYCANKAVPIKKRRNSDSETSKRRNVSSDEEYQEDLTTKISNDSGATNVLPSRSKTNSTKRVRSPHYMLPTVASKNANLISANPNPNHSKSRVISAAIHRTPRRLLPLHVEFKRQNSNIKTKSNAPSSKSTTARLPPIDQPTNLPNMPYQQQRSMSSYSQRSLKSTLLPLSRAHTNDALFEDTDEDLQSLRSTLIISPLLNHRKEMKIQEETKQVVQQQQNNTKTNEKSPTKKKMSFPF